MVVYMHIIEVTNPNFSTSAIQCGAKVNYFLVNINKKCDDYNASITVTYQLLNTINKTSHTFDATHKGNMENGEILLTGGAIDLCLSDYFKGQRIGTYLMNIIVQWAKNWPNANINQIKLLTFQAQPENKERRNKFYEQFNIKFNYVNTITREDGTSLPMTASNLNPVVTWKENIKEYQIKDFISKYKQNIKYYHYLSEQQAILDKWKKNMIDSTFITLLKYLMNKKYFKRNRILALKNRNDFRITYVVTEQDINKLIESLSALIACVSESQIDDSERKIGDLIEAQTKFIKNPVRMTWNIMTCKFNNLCGKFM